MLRKGWTEGVVWLLCGGAALVGCSKKTRSEQAPPPSVSSTPSAQAVTVATVEKEPEPPKAVLSFRLAHHFEGPVTLFPLVKGVLACVHCDIFDKPNNDRHVFFFDGKDVKELPGLLSDKRISANIGQSVTELLKPFNGGKYTFSGSGPSQLNLEVYGWLDDGSNGRQGYPHEERYLAFDGKSWQFGRADYPQNNDLYAHDHPYTPLNGLPRKYDDALLHGSRGVAVVSDDGPLLQIVNGRYSEGLPQKNRVDSWDGKAWRQRAAPWGLPFVVQRLAGGRTLLLADNGAYGIDERGVPTPIALEDGPARGSDLKMLLVGREPWLLSPRNVYLPSEPGLSASVAPAREPSLRRPAPPAVAAASASAVTSSPIAPSASVVGLASAAPSASVAVIPSALPAASVVGSASAGPIPSASAAAAVSTGNEPELASGIPAMSNFSERCKTPFVVLFTPPEPHWNYLEAVNNLVAAAPLQDSLWFAEFTRNKVTYFGAQAADEATARALIAAYVGKVPKAKPVLGCLDVKAYLPDPYTPKWDAERYLINLGSAQIL